jgi:hypothetical protein
LKRILATVGAHPYVTKVPTVLVKLGVGMAICLAMSASAGAQTAPASPPQSPDSGPAKALYLQLSSIGIDPDRVFRVRDSSIDRPAIHITLEDGAIGFTKDILGHITGAFFEGEGEVLLVPPNNVERKSLSLFTGMAILEERFSTAYFRFNDNTAAELQPGFRAPEDAAGLVARWNDSARNLAQTDAMRLLESFSALLPTADRTASPSSGTAEKQNDRFLHARVQGDKLGVFDIFFDATAGEQVEVGQAKTAENGGTYYDVWTSFALEEPGPAAAEKTRHKSHPNPHPDDPIVLRSYVIDARVKPPKELDAEVFLNLDVKRDTERFLVFELSRFLKIQTVEQDGHAVEFIQNPAVEGTRLARSGNDMVAVILAAPPRKGDKIALRFVYAGEVLAEAGKGLLYVGARGMWYPNRGLAMSDFDLTFHYPPGWTLVATGKPTPVPVSKTSPENPNDQISRWVSERPLPVAGFDLGKYVRVAVQAGNVSVETYATAVMEKDFPVASRQIDPGPDSTVRKPTQPLTASFIPSPARNAAAVSDLAARAVRYYAARFGPFPYSKLGLTQLPGRASQGWPGLIFLSSYAFLTPEERRDIHMDASREAMDQQVPAHEVAHQWWGDLITWKTYRDQWFSEGLANYCSLMMLQERNPESFREILETYRNDLVEKDKNGNLPKDAGPVTLGSRLLSSHFPEGYEAISYGRGTWLFHMLRTMLQDAAPRQDSNSSEEEPFVRALRRLRQRYAGEAVGTQEILDVFAEDLPPSLRYEGKASLDWFLDGWINGTSLPKLELQGVKFTAGANSVIATGTIRQKDAEDNLVTSVPIYAVISGKAPTLIGRVFADGAESSFRIAAPAGTHKLLLDPNKTILTSQK